jgi:hypothetical protein
MCTKLVELFANWVVERRNMINDYLSGRACIESVRGVYFGGSIDFELSLDLGMITIHRLPSNHVRVHAAHDREHGCYNSFTLCRGCTHYPGVVIILR